MRSTCRASGPSLPGRGPDGKGLPESGGTADRLGEAARHILAGKARAGITGETQQTSSLQRLFPKAGITEAEIISTQ